MASIESVYKVKLKNGWRAIIYDAPWAYFKHDQEGVIITSDGKACETTDDEKDNIIVIADPYIGFDKRENGHILFRQKGSDLFDIVCLSQEGGGTYEVKVRDAADKTNDIIIDGCAGSWNEFKSKLKVFETVNGNRVELPESGYKILSPTAQFTFTNDSETEDIVMTDFIEVMSLTEVEGISEEDKIAKGTLIIKASGTEYRQPRTDGSGSIVGDIDLSVITVEKLSSGSRVYTINKSNEYTECEGGKVTFSLKTTETETPQYKVILKSGSITILVDYIKCGLVVRTEEETISTSENITYSIEGNVTEISRTDSEIILDIEDGVSEFTLKAVTSSGITKSAKFVRDSDSNFIYYGQV